jgi:ABC-type Fe3+/spermidine/putrescine transport system ATPase subunit
VLRGLSLSIGPGATAVLGPSGCGKSTLLRLVAGLDPVAAGTISLGGEDITGRSPRERDVAWTAQDNPLYPHLDVEENIGFALRARKE